MSRLKLTARSWNFKGFVNLRSGYQESAPFEMPVLYPTTSEFGIVSADNSFYTEGWIVTGPLTYYIKYDDLTLHAFASPELAKASLGTNIAAVCLESVAEDEEPAQCAASFPKLSGPSYLYATGDGGADAGYVSVNANTGKITWARTQVSYSSGLQNSLCAHFSRRPSQLLSTLRSLARANRKSCSSRSGTQLGRCMPQQDSRQSRLGLEAERQAC